MVSQREIDSIRLAAKEGRLEQHLKELEHFQKEEHVCTITWQIDDVAELMKGSSRSEIKEVAKKSAKVLSDRSTEEGWEILSDLVNFHTH